MQRFQQQKTLGHLLFQIPGMYFWESHLLLIIICCHLPIHRSKLIHENVGSLSLNISTTNPRIQVYLLFVGTKINPRHRLALVQFLLKTFCLQTLLLIFLRFARTSFSPLFPFSQHPSPFIFPPFLRVDMLLTLYFPHFFLLLPPLLILFQ